MDVPTPTEIRAWAPPLFDWTKYGFPVPDPPTDPEPLAFRIDNSVAELYAITGRTLESIQSVEAQMVRRLLTVFTMSEAVGGGAAALKLMNDPSIKSFTAGSYSQTRFTPAELAGQSGGSTMQPPFPPALWAMLWSLMTDEKRAEWQQRLSGVNAPAMAVMPVPGLHHDGLDGEWGVW